MINLKVEIICFRVALGSKVESVLGQTFAIDVYCFLHKGAFGCAEQLVQGKPTDGYIKYVMKYVNLLLYHDIKPILVFDGRNLPSKVNKILNQNFRQFTL